MSSRPNSSRCFRWSTKRALPLVDELVLVDDDVAPELVEDDVAPELVEVDDPPV